MQRSHYSYQIDHITFEDGTKLSKEDLTALALTVTGTEGADVLRAETTGSILKGLGGNDSLYGGNGKDTLMGDEGDDIINGGEGNDLLIGGSGDDSLEGGFGSDTYIFGKNFGRDFIYNYDYDTYRKDIIQFTEGWKASDFTYQRSGTNLVIAAKQGTDQITVEDIRALAYEATEGNDELYADPAGSVINGLEGDDKLYGSVGYDKLYGGEGNDVITDDYYDTIGNNYLDGGAGDDTLMGAGTLKGGTGNDTIYSRYNKYFGNTILFDLGDGQDTIRSQNSGNMPDKLVFGEGITADMLSFSSNQLDLVIRIGEADKITIKEYFRYETRQNISIFEFADGTVWTDAREQPTLKELVALLTNVNLIEGSYTADTLIGSSGDDLIYGKEGNDTITDNTGNNTLDGGTGDDKITGRGIFIGGTGNDTLTANVVGSADTFVFNLGDGKDIITSTDSAQTTDTLKFGEGITKEMISYRKNGYYLIVFVGNEGDQITLTNYFLNLNNQTVNRFEFSDGSAWEDIRQTQLRQYYTDVVETITGTQWDDVIYGLGGNDTITDNVGSNWLDGGAGDDKITGRGTFVGGIGNDTLTANVVGSLDTFIFNLGDGKDIITSTDSAKTTDILKFGVGITEDMVSYYQSGNNLIIKVGDQGDQITLTNYFYNLNHQTVNRFEFSDGTIWEDIRLRPITKILTEGADVITGSGLSDVIYGLGGNDTITDNAGNNILDGGAGADTLIGKGTFIGGTGNDIIHANINGSADTVIFNLGDGKDTIYSYDTAQTTDTLKFGKGITADMISYRKSGNHLIVFVGDQGDQITLTNYFYNLNNQTVNRFEFADGTVWEDIRQTALTQYYTDSAETITGAPWDDVIYGEGGNDIITDNAGNNYLDGGAGNDRITGTGTLVGGTGADTLTGSGTFIGGIGNDIINAKTNGSADMFIFNLGDGQDTISCLDTQKLTDTLKFGAGVTSNMVTHSQVGNNLILTIGSTGDKITVVSYFSGSNYRTLNQIEFTDGTKWTANDQKGAAFGYQVTPPPANASYAAPAIAVANGSIMSTQVNSNFDISSDLRETVSKDIVQQKAQLVPNNILDPDKPIVDKTAEIMADFETSNTLKIQTMMGQKAIINQKALSTNAPNDDSPIIEPMDKMIPIPPEKYLSASMEQNPLTALYEADRYGVNTGKGMNADDARSLQSMVSAMAAFGTGTGSSNDLIDSDYSMVPRVFAPTN